MMIFLRAQVLALALLLSCPALAAPGTPDSATQATARDQVRQGRQALRQRNLLAALRHFRKAYRLWPRKENAFNLALVYHELGDKVSAATHLLRYLDRATPAERKRLTSILRQLLKSVGVLSVEAPKSQMEIWVDGRHVGTGRARVALAPGGHRAQLRQGKKVVLEWAQTVAGGQRLRWLPSLAVPQRRPARRRAATKSTTLQRSWTKRKRLHWAYFAVATVVAVAAAGALIPLGLKTRELEADFDATPTADIQRRGKRYENATNAMVGLTAVAGAAAVVLAIFTRWRSKERAKRLTVLPEIGPQGAGMTLRLEY